MATLTATTKLEAVNLILAAIGESPVNSLTDPAFATASQAEQELDRTSRAVQSIGWYFNEECEVSLSLNGDSKYPVPTNALRVEISDVEGRQKYTQRGNFIYNKEKQTYIFTNSTLKVDIVYYLDWTELPEAARYYIAVKAARKFAQKFLSSDDVTLFSQVDEVEAKSIMVKADAATRKANILTSNRRGIRATNRGR